MYEKHFGFKVKPFQTIPNPAFYFPSAKHEKAMTYLEYGLMERTGFILLTGEIGSGKTTLIRHLMNKIESEIDTALIFNTNVTSEQLVCQILSEFDLTPGNAGKSDTLDMLYKFLIDRYAQHRRVLLIIDEAQNLSREALEEVRMLSNLQSDDQMLLQIMLVGQPELRTKIRKPNLAQLNQRITVAYHLPALTREETEAYIAFRIEKAGGKSDLFTHEAVDLIHETSYGIPRSINIICDTALVYGYADDLNSIPLSVIQQVIEDREGVGLTYQPMETIDQKDHVRSDGALEKRVVALEDLLNKFRIHAGTKLADMEKAMHILKDKLVGHLKGQYERERQKNEKIVDEYSKLKGKYIDLLKKLKERDNQSTSTQEIKSVTPLMTNHPLPNENTPDAPQLPDIVAKDETITGMGREKASRVKIKGSSTKKTQRKKSVT